MCVSLQKNSNDMPENQQQHTSLVLSGGGVRGMAHIGFIRAINEHGIQIDRVAGASACALVGALFAKRKPHR